MFAAWSAALYAVAYLRSAERPSTPASARSRATRAHLIELFFRRSMMLNVLAGQQFRPSHVGFLVRIPLSRGRPLSGSGPSRLPSFEILAPKIGRASCRERV